jgi:hypothetical protein
MLTPIVKLLVPMAFVDLLSQGRRHWEHEVIAQKLSCLLEQSFQAVSTFASFSVGQHPVILRQIRLLCHLAKAHQGLCLGAKEVSWGFVGIGLTTCFSFFMGSLLLIGKSPDCIHDLWLRLCESQAVSQASHGS